MAFWGVQVKPGKVTPFVPPPEGSKLHLSQAALSPAAAAGQKAALLVKVGDGEPLAVCVLREGGSESQNLDLIFDSYTEFSVEGGAGVHLTGYFMPEYELDDAHDYSDEDEEGEDGQLAGQIVGYDPYGVPILAGDDYDSEEDSDFDSEDDDAEEGDMLLGSDDEDEEGSSSEEEDDGLVQLGRGRKVTIEEITDDQPAEPAAGAPKPAAQQAAGKKAEQQANGKKALQFDDEDVEASDDEEDEESSEGEEEEESESEEDAPAAQHAGAKRKAGAEPATSKKQAVEAAKGGKPVAAQQAQQQKQPQAKPEKAKPQQQAQQAKQAQQQAKTPAKTPAKEEPVAANELPSSNKKVRRFANGFEIEEVKRGRPDAKLAKPGKRVVVKYVGRLKSNNKIFDQTQGNKTFTFRLGVGEVIKGWDKGVENMRVGDKRKLTIPPQMAYGAQGVRGAIPGNATLLFDVELVDVK